MSRKPSLKPGTLSRDELHERRVSDLERMARRVPARAVAGGSRSTEEIVQQVAHAFTVGTVVGHEGGDWTSGGTATPSGIVSAVLSPDVFVVTTGGVIEGLSGLVDGADYFDVGGTLTPFDPNSNTNHVTIVLHATSATAGVVFIYEKSSVGIDSGVVGIFELPDTWGLGTPLADDGSIGQATASTDAGARVFGIISGALAVGGTGNLIYVVRNAGHIGSDDLLGHFWISPFDVPGWTLGPYYLSATAGAVATTAPASPNTANIVLEATDGGLYAAPQAVSPMRWDAINDKPAAFPPSGSVTLTVDSTDTTASASLTFSGTIGAAVWNFYEKRPRFNAKWLLNAELAAGVGAVSGASEPDLFLWWDKTNTKWATFEWFPGSPVVGDLNVYDPAAADTNAKMTKVAAGTACSLFGRSANSAGLPAPIAASANGTMVQRFGDVVEFSDAPTLTRGGVDFKLCTVNTITTTTTAPSASGVKGQMHFIY